MPKLRKLTPLQVGDFLIIISQLKFLVRIIFNHFLWYCFGTTHFLTCCNPYFGNHCFRLCIASAPLICRHERFLTPGQVKFAGSCCSPLLCYKNAARLQPFPVRKWLKGIGCFYMTIRQIMVAFV